MNLLYVTNGAAVGIFGMVLSGAFCDIHWTKEKREFLVGSIFVLLVIQGVMYLLAGAATIRYLYPVITHVPMCIALYILTKKRLWTVISVLTAYLCCQLRRWVALFIMAVFVNSETVQNVTELIAIRCRYYFFYCVLWHPRCGQYQIIPCQYSFSSG